VSPMVQRVVRDESAQCDRFVSAMLDAMAAKVGEMQATRVGLEVMDNQAAGLAGVKPEELQPLQRHRPVATAAPTLRWQLSRSSRCPKPCGRWTRRSTWTSTCSPCSSRVCSKHGCRR